MMIERIRTIVTQALVRRGLDWRTCYADVRAEPSGGTPIRVECSDGGVLEETRAELGCGEGSEVPVRFVPLPDADDRLPEWFVPSISVADLRREPSHAAELVSQAIASERLAPLKQSGDWVLVRMGDGYLGYIRGWSLKPISTGEWQRFVSDAAWRVRDNVIQIFGAPKFGSLPVCDAVAGTLLVARNCGRRGWRAVELANGRTGFVIARQLERVPLGNRVSRGKLRETGLRFLGVPYVWGGTTPKGFDCSGLVQRIFSLNGVMIPRDSDLQSRVGRMKPTAGTDELDTGDLLFFGASDTEITHVAMCIGDGLFVHARGEVRLNAIDSRHPLFDGKLVGDWRVTRDALSV